MTLYIEDGWLLRGATSYFRYIYHYQEVLPKVAFDAKSGAHADNLSANRELVVSRSGGWVAGMTSRDSAAA